MPALDSLTIKIPFSGFYNSIWSDMLDSAERNHVYDVTEGGSNEGDENTFPEPIRLDGNEIASAVFSAMNYSKAHNDIARDYTKEFSCVAGEYLGGDLGLEFEELTRPKFYNFETDRIFARIPTGVVDRLFSIAVADGFKTLKTVIAERFTSRSGFRSHYNNELDAWLDKPLHDWDHNELETLLIAALKTLEGDVTERDIENDIAGSLAEDDWQYFEDSMNWDAYETAVQEARAEKLADWREDDPAAAEEYEPTNGDIPTRRCPKTPDMFSGAV